MVGHGAQVLGYVRLDVVDQNEARQGEALGDFDRLFSEEVSGTSSSRVQFQEMFAYVHHRLDAQRAEGE